MSQKCRARRTDGQPCQAWAITGGAVCVTHGGAAKQVKRAAAERVELEKLQRQAALFGVPRDVDPSQALLDLVHWTAGEVEFWRNEVRQIAERDKDSLTWGQTKSETGVDQDKSTDLEVHEAKPHVAYGMLYAAQDRLEKYASAALRAGIEERRVRLAEAHADQVVMAIRRILAALSLTPEQAALIPEVVPREIRAITAEPAQLVVNR